MLLCWELGAGSGHLTRLLPVAQRFRDDGHAVLVAARDVQAAASVLGPACIEFAQAPFAVEERVLAGGLASYAEILLTQGWGERARLWGLVQGWLALFSMFRPDLVLVDHSPAALFAARIANLPRMQIGNGFELPPRETPLPAFRDWGDVAPGRIARSEETALATANAVAAAHKAPPMRALRELFDLDAQVLATFAELDHYGERPGAAYAGNAFTLGEGGETRWQGGRGKRIFAYLRPGTPGLQALLAVLSAYPAETICAAPGVRNEAAGNRTMFFNRPLGIAQLVREADLAVTYGAIGTMAAFLLAGVPQLMVPGTVEQFLVSRRAEENGAGIALCDGVAEQDFEQAIERLLGENSYRNRAEAFANKYAGFDPMSLTETATRVAYALV